ncbi:MAG TPA: ATP synthase F1 subunit delta [Candidatus Kapabacteria bacterium]|jgi:F-type H+-transporting ATPase subunit delta
MNRRVAARYALAIMELGQERNELDRIAEDLRDVQATIHGSRELLLLLISPVIAPDSKLKVLNELFGKRCGEVTMKAIALLIKKGRSEYLLGTAEEFLRMLDAKNGVLGAKIESAISLTPNEQKAIVTKLEAMTGKKLRPQFSTDPKLRGGFVARMGDEMIDASLRHQLEMLREQFAQGAPILN